MLTTTVKARALARSLAATVSVMSCEPTDMKEGAKTEGSGVCPEKPSSSA